jgi:RimJ/RimL family protein N-acetyltransferase
MNLKRIIGITFPDHNASMRVMEKAGMSRIENKNYYDQEMAVYEKNYGKKYKKQ